MSRGDHYRRLLAAYALGLPSHLDFWHETPQIHPDATCEKLGPYYMAYRKKSAYRGPFDGEGIPLLNYRGAIGLRHNPIAAAQYGLSQYNRYCEAGSPEARRKFLTVADWLCRRLTRNQKGVDVWSHEFLWPYRQGLQPPWASALAQGQGISVLVRAARVTQEGRYQEAAGRALAAFTRPVQEGGVVISDGEDGLWLEEYLVEPPSHILNGAISAAWGLFDYGLATGDATAKKLFGQSVCTLARNLSRYDAGFWSLYELPSDGIAASPASPFYHRLHIVQLEILFRMTGEPIFDQTAARWEEYRRSFRNRMLALWRKGLFKLRYY